MEQTLSISDCSQAVGLSQKQLRQYEQRRYISAPLRITCGTIRYRRYTKKNIKELKIFKNFLKQGFTLPVSSAKTAELRNK